jgi:NodT family efflux transporter outer membrane factor (OMF) lipoprotein
VKRESGENSTWWTAFNDPVLTTLIETAYRQNPSLQAAGSRVLEAQARRGIAIGQLFPQQQDAFGSYTRNDISTKTANQGAFPGFTSSFDNWQIGLEATWEVDLWGRFRRGIEAADAGLLASVASYDDVLVSLIGEVATNYIFLRILGERLEVAQANVTVQQRSFDIADAKFQGGAVTELDAAQAAALLRDTQAQVSALETSVQQTQNTLSVLLGLPPQGLQEILRGTKTIPSPPTAVAVGIPADLLRRRPDIRRAERQLAAQSAEIGIAQADFFPRFSLFGTLSVTAEEFTDLFTSAGLDNFIGPGFRWAILNYGRIQNNVRVQDARFQALISDYETTVLQAQREVEDAIAGYLGTQREVALLTNSVGSAARAVELADFQYREGATDYTRVLTTQQFLVNAQDRLVATRGAVSLNLVTLYRALGGGWELRTGKDFVSDTTTSQMRERTNWGDLLRPEERAADINAATSDIKNDPGQWQWRKWTPRW